MHQLHLVTQRLREAEIIHIAGALDDHNFVTLDNFMDTAMDTCGF